MTRVALWKWFLCLPNFSNQPMLNQKFSPLVQPGGHLSWSTLFAVKNELGTGKLPHPPQACEASLPTATLSNGCHFSSEAGRTLLVPQCFKRYRQLRVSPFWRIMIRDWRTATLPRETRLCLWQQTVC